MYDVCVSLNPTLQYTTGAGRTGVLMVPIAVSAISHNLKTQANQLEQ